jgi:RNA polymerase sigma-70 factor (ECF subfamily)
LHREERALHLASAIEKLPEPQRDAIVLHYWQQKSIAETGVMMGRTPAAVSGLLYRGLRQLRQSLRHLE